MGDNFQEMRRLELDELSNNLRMSRYLIDIGLLEDTLEDDDWPSFRELMDIITRSREYAEETWQAQTAQNEPKDPEPASQEAIDNLETSVVEIADDDCSICLFAFKKDEVTKTMPCQHTFHEECLLKWLCENNTCPFCRHQLPTESD